jgi:hypothetical protein
MVAQNVSEFVKWNLEKGLTDSASYVIACLHISSDSSVGIATGYELDDRMIGVRFRAGAGNFSLRHHVQTDSGVHAAPYPMGTGGSFPGGKAAGAWSWPLTSI